MRIFLAVFLFLWSSNLSFTQNLLPNGSFELVNNFTYENPPQAFPFLEYWYAANALPPSFMYNGTPDLFDFDNQWPASTPLNFWNVTNGAVDGDYHAGIANHFLYTGYTQPEAIASPLTEALEANEFYHVELHFRNKGVSGYLNPPILCVPELYKNIELYLDPDSIFVTIDEPNMMSYTEASKMLVLRHPPAMGSSLPGTWYHVGSCFQADGGERFFATTLQNGNFEVNAPCMIYDEHWDAFYVYYFDIDDIKLTKLPKEVKLSESICQGRTLRINIADYADLPIMQNEIEYHWEDGTIDSVNYISAAGTYQIDAIIDCTTIPIFLEVNDFNCDVKAYVPNVFTPNSDGINDQLQVYLSDNLPVENYQFTVFNRWGATVFKSNDPLDSWDGKFRNIPADEGVYIWQLEFTVFDPDEGLIRFKKSDSVTILR